MGWDESYWAEADYWPDEEWDQHWGDAQHVQHDQLPAEEPPAEDPQLQDAMKVEREAESLAMQAQRSWQKLKGPLQLFVEIVVPVNKAVLVMSNVSFAMATTLPGIVLTECIPPPNPRARASSTMQLSGRIPSSST